MKDMLEQLIELNADLIHVIKRVIKKNGISSQKNDWDNPKNWSMVVSSLTEYRESLSVDVLQYAEVQVGLAKFLDYYSMDWMEDGDKKTIQGLVTQIVSLSLQIIINNLAKSRYVGYRPNTHSHEDSACMSGRLGSRYIATGDVILKNWPTLPMKDAVNFLFPPHNDTLKCEKIYRILEKGVNNPCGNWWFRDFPKSKKIGVRNML